MDQDTLLKLQSIRSLQQDFSSLFLTLKFMNQASFTTLSIPYRLIHIVLPKEISPLRSNQYRPDCSFSV